ncbi:MAG: enoyl-CoA hydratase-related protein [Bacteroidetes bacterium]|nr:enoyl-CoA hydratase-related protein [Bacteroidota bacterium]
MNTYQTIETSKDERVLTIRLNRPDKHNAFNELMLQELTDIFGKVQQFDDVICVLLRGNGRSFCAGVDLNWMKDVAANTYEKNYRESLYLAECFYTIYSCTKPTVAVVHGSVLGGANGLVASCDMAYCTDDAVFSLSEVKIGIVPACISPYVIKRIGESGAKELMLTGRRISGKEAEAYRLVNRSFPSNELDAAVEAVISQLRSSGPEAMSHCKTLIDNVSNNLSMKEAIEFTARMIAEIRASEEGQEGMAAFLEKRKPKWVNKAAR